MPVVPTHHYRETYTADALDELAATFRIPVEHRAEMAKLLEDAAAIWRWKTAGREGQVAPFIAAKKLSDLSKQAYKLKATLDALPAAAITAFIAEMDHVESKIIAGVKDKGPFLGYMVPQSDGSEYPVFLGLRDIDQLITALAATAYRASDLSNGKKGKLADQALLVWVANIEMFWTQTLGRPFTRDVGSNGEPLTEAGQFCAAAFRYVSPNTPENTVSNAMKRHISAVKRKSLAK